MVYFPWQLAKAETGHWPGTPPSISTEPSLRTRTADPGPCHARIECEADCPTNCPVLEPEIHVQSPVVPVHVFGPSYLSDDTALRLRGTLPYSAPIHDPAADMGPWPGRTAAPNERRLLDPLVGGRPDVIPRDDILVLQVGPLRVDVDLRWATSYGTPTFLTVRKCQVAKLTVALVVPVISSGVSPHILYLPGSAHRRLGCIYLGHRTDDKSKISAWRSDTGNPSKVQRFFHKSGICRGRLPVGSVFLLSGNRRFLVSVAWPHDAAGTKLICWLPYLVSFRCTVPLPMEDIQETALHNESQGKSAYRCYTTSLRCEQSAYYLVKLSAITRSRNTTALSSQAALNAIDHRYTRWQLCIFGAVLWFASFEGLLATFAPHSYLYGLIGSMACYEPINALSFSTS